MRNYTVRVDGQFVGTINAETALYAAKVLAPNESYIEVTNTASGVVEEFDLG